MQIKKHIVPILLTITIIILSSCSVNRRMATRYQTLSQRVQLDLEWNMSRYSMNGSIRVWRNEMVVVSVQPMLGIEMVRIEATLDSICVFDKMNRRYLAMGYSELEQKTTKKITYKTIQDFASQPITNNEKDKIVIEVTTGDNQLKLSSKFSNREYNTLQAPTKTKTNRYKRVSLEEILPI